MTFGTVASKEFCDFMDFRHSPYMELFDPTRVKLVAGFTNLVKECADLIASKAKEKNIVKELHSPEKLIPGEAKTYCYAGSILAFYKDTRSVLHVIGSTYPHTYCHVHRDSLEESRAFSCYGSRFGINNKAIHALAVKDLNKIEISEVNNAMNNAVLNLII